MIQGGSTASLKSEAVQSSVAASVTSHSCQVWGMSGPWHLSNPSYLELSPPASRQLISPDTSHGPDRESFSPENNPALLPLHPQIVACRPHLCLSSSDFSLPFSLPICPFPITSPHGLLFLSCLHLSLSGHILLLLYLARSFLPLSSLLRSTLPRWVYHACADENLQGEAMIADWGIACVSLRPHQHSETAFGSRGGCCQSWRVFISERTFAGGEKLHRIILGWEHIRMHLSLDTRHP